MKLAYRKFGQGQPLIILHGLFGQSDNWFTLAKRFGENGFRVFTIDQRNHGLSPHNDNWNYEVMANDLKEFIDEHELTFPILLGHSMGGKTVLFFEYLHPSISKANIIVDIAPRSYLPHHQNVLLALNAVDFSKINTRKEAEAILGNFISDFGTKQFLLKNIYWREDETKQMDWRFNIKVISKNIDSIGVELPFFITNKPFFFIRGQLSNYINENDIVDIKTRFLNCKIETILDSGHWVHAEKPDDFFNVLIKNIS
ncbi:MAG: alpha/beta fold hydrolase [Bacteroidota bacterium]